MKKEEKIKAAIELYQQSLKLRLSWSTRLLLIDEFITALEALSQGHEGDELEELEKLMEALKSMYN